MPVPVGGPMDGSKHEDSSTPSAEQQRRQQARAYQGAMEAVFSIVIAVGLGYWADYYFETLPLYLLIGVGVGLGAFVLRIVRMRPEDEETKGATGSVQDESEE